MEAPFGTVREMTDYRKVIELRFCLTFIQGLAERAIERDDPYFYRALVEEIERNAREALAATKTEKAA